MVLRLRRDRKVAVVVLFKGEAAAGPSPQRRLSSEVTAAASSPDYAALFAHDRVVAVDLARNS